MLRGRRVGDTRTAAQVQVLAVGVGYDLNASCCRGPKLLESRLRNDGSDGTDIGNETWKRKDVFRIR